MTCIRMCQCVQTIAVAHCLLHIVTEISNETNLAVAGINIILVDRMVIGILRIEIAVLIKVGVGVTVSKIQRDIGRGEKTI